MSEAAKTQNRLGGTWLLALGAVLLVVFVTASQAGWSMDRLGFESFVLLWPLTYIGAVVMWFLRVRQSPCLVVLLPRSAAGCVRRPPGDRADERP